MPKDGDVLPSLISGESPSVRIVHPSLPPPVFILSTYKGLGQGDTRNGNLEGDWTVQRRGMKEAQKHQGKKRLFFLWHAVGFLPLLEGGRGIDGPAEEECKSEGSLRLQAGGRGAQGSVETRKMGQARRAWTVTPSQVGRAGRVGGGQTSSSSSW